MRRLADPAGAHRQGEGHAHRRVWHVRHHLHPRDDGEWIYDDADLTALGNDGGSETATTDSGWGQWIRDGDDRSEATTTNPRLADSSRLIGAHQWRQHCNGDDDGIHGGGGDLDPGLAGWARGWPPVFFFFFLFRWHH
ncbi:hypothetical protein PAHAL_3G163600 [Panicum hallii]|uniref:Uncharacterized protein n=1 Tax=Panicum hallii TaxID=206008 RepID=A0A2T8KIE9_9POAL|nr:hypothetical protein PAHAL_3G163600 [Panicum hallii]